jgi:hypothetical protein
MISGTKPPLGAQINWGHPLAQGLMEYWLLNEGAGSSLRELVNGRFATWGASPVNQPQWLGYERGRAVGFRTGGSTGDRFATPSAYLLPMSDPQNISIAASAMVYDTTQRTIYSPDNTSQMPQLEVNTLGGGYVGITGPGQVYAATVAGAISVNRMYSLLYIHAQYSSGHKIYVDGQSVALSINLTGTYLNSAAIRIIGGRYSSGAQNWSGIISYVGVWNRTLSAMEADTLHVDPWSIVSPPSYRKWFGPTGGLATYDWHPEISRPTVTKTEILAY